MKKSAKLPPLQITEREPSAIVVAGPTALQRELEQVGEATGYPMARALELASIDPRRLLPVVPERHTFPLDFVHDAPMVKRAGGMPLIVEGLVELMPGAKVRFDRPETVPPPVRAVMKALRQRKPFYLVIGVGEEAWWVELKK